MQVLSALAASLQRLYRANKVTKNTIFALVESGKISKDEYRQIINEEV